MTLGSSRWRRVALAVLAIALSLMLLRSQLSAALVVRGDDLLYQSQEGRALHFYGRALLFDPNNAAAADRYVFVSMMMRRKPQLESAVATASMFLAQQEDATVLMDRALCERLLWRNRAAESDFARAGLITRDARALVFAGYSALRQGSRLRAHHWWRVALMFSAGYVPAQRALRLR